MTNTIVPSYQWVLHEFARTRRCPFALSWRACAQGSGLLSLSGLHFITGQRESASTYASAFSVLGFQSVGGWISSEQRWNWGSSVMISSLGRPMIK